MKRQGILSIAAAAGYVSLSQEILWAKVLSNANEGRPEAFAHMLGVFLLGIAFGALAGRRVQQVLGVQGLAFVGAMAALSGVVFFGAFPLGAHVLTLSAGWGLLVFHGLVLATAFLMGGIFPALCDLGASPRAGVGRSVSWIYLANIIGATAGPVITGFVLLDLGTVAQNILLVSALSLLLAAGVVLRMPISRGAKGAVAGGLVLVVVGMVALQPIAYRHFWERVHFPAAYPTSGTYLFLEESRSGIAGVWPPDWLYGGGVYDGRYNLDPVDNTNLITRAYFLPVLQPDLRRIYMVGLGSGSWARALADYPGVEEIVVVEINPAYVALARRFPEVASVLDDPRVQVVIDDGRHWLYRHADARFDAIVMNVTWHWRGYATHVLSEDFLKVCKARLNPGGVVYCNATGSNDVLYTAAHVFEYVTTFVNFVAASDRPFDLPADLRRLHLMKFERHGQPVFSGAAAAVLEEMVAVDTQNRAPELRAATGLWRITDDNMATEFKTNGSGAWWRALWGRVYRPESAWLARFF